MSIILDLPQDLERELAAEAERLGLPLSEYALRILATGRIAKPMPVNGAELVEYWRSEGLIGSRTDIADSQEHARMLREEAQRRSQE